MFPRSIVHVLVLLCVLVVGPYVLHFVDTYTVLSNFIGQAILPMWHKTNISVVVSSYADMVQLWLPLVTYHPERVTISFRGSPLNPTIWTTS